MGCRDRDLIRRLQRNPSFAKLEAQGAIISREGVIFGNRKKLESSIEGRRYIDTRTFATINDPYIDARLLGTVTDLYIDSRASSDFQAFQPPQLIIKASWVQATSRFQSKLVVDDVDNSGVICNQSFISVRSLLPNTALLQIACLCYNSSWATYFMFMTSGRFAFDRSEPLTSELLGLPLPHGFESFRFTENVTESAIFDWLSLKETDRILIDDLMNYALPDSKGKGYPAGYRRTRRSAYSDLRQELEPDLKQYSDILMRVLRAAYGNDKAIGILIFSEARERQLPMRHLQVRLNDKNITDVRVVNLESDELDRLIAQSYDVSRQQTNRKGFVYQRSIRSYESHRQDGNIIVNVDIVKPDQIRYWLKSSALRDADELVSDMTGWAMASDATKLA